MAERNAAAARQDLWRSARGLSCDVCWEKNGVEIHFIRGARDDVRRRARVGRGGAMPLHPGEARSRGLLSAAGCRTCRQAQAGKDQRYHGGGAAEADAAERRGGLPKPAQHLPRLLSRSSYTLPRQLPARFSAKEARPSEASVVWRRAAWI